MGRFDHLLVKLRIEERSVLACKGLSKVERAFRRLKTVDLNPGAPGHPRLPDQVRAHVFGCMHYVEWHLRQRLAPALFDDEDPAAGEALRPSPVAPARRSPAAERKAAIKRTDDDMPIHSFGTLLADLATIAKNRIRLAVPGAEPFEKITRPTPNQQRILDLLDVSL